MKKSVAVFLAVLTLLMSLCLAAGAVSVSDGDDALRAQFASGSGGGLDYRYFAPAAADDMKYPLVIFLHGINSGYYDGDQLDSYDFCKWASDEYQSRFYESHGAFLFCPRASGTWDTTPDGTLMNCIKSFVSKYSAKIDTDKIYITGFSAGATKTINMAGAYPDYFAAAVPISAVAQVAGNISNMKNMSVWFFANERDTYVSANRAATEKSFNSLKSVAADKSAIRFTWVSSAVDQFGNTVGTQHYMWRTFTNDMFMADGSPYANATTVDGNGKTVSFRFPDGVIDWLSRQTKYAAPTVKLTFWQRLIAFFKKLFGFLL